MALFIMCLTVVMEGSKSFMMYDDKDYEAL